MRVLGIDPGIDITGFAVADINGSSYELIDCGIIKTERELTLPARLHQLRADLNTLLNQYQDIEACGIEELFFSKNVTTAAMVWQARGVILECIAEQGIGHIVEIKPNQVKMYVAGSGSAQKPEMQKMVQITFGLAGIPKPDDAADAAAIALATESLLRLGHK